MNTFLFKTFHSWHHRLYVPYSYGALYNHPVEGLVLDSCGAVISEWLTGMSLRQAALLFTIATFKTVDDHCGYSLPFDPLQWFTSNNADYHDIHHQVCPPHQISGCISLNPTIDYWNKVQLLTAVLHALGCASWDTDDETRHQGSQTTQGRGDKIFVTQIAPLTLR